MKRSLNYVCLEETSYRGEVDPMRMLGGSLHFPMTTCEGHHNPARDQIPPEQEEGAPDKTRHDVQRAGQEQ